MKHETFFKWFFISIGLYDVALGLIFVFFYVNIFNYFQITLPNHPGYVYMPALFLSCAGFGEFLIAKNLLRNIDLALVRLLMKLSFAGIVFYSYFVHGVPMMFLLIAAASLVGVVVNMYYMYCVVKGL